MSGSDPAPNRAAPLRLLGARAGPHLGTLIPLLTERLHCGNLGITVASPPSPTDPAPNRAAPLRQDHVAVGVDAEHADPAPNRAAPLRHGNEAGSHREVQELIPLLTERLHCGNGTRARVLLT